MQYLPLQIREIDVVEVDKADRSDSSGSEIKRDR
jgi:hypothetical protein